MCRAIAWTCAQAHSQTLKCENGCVRVEKAGGGRGGGGGGGGDVGTPVTLQMPLQLVTV